MIVLVFDTTKSGEMLEQYLLRSDHQLATHL